MAKLKSVSIPVTGNTAPLRKALKSANKDLTAFGKAQQGILNAQNVAFGIAGSAAAKFALDAVKAATSDAKSQALLADQLRKTTGATNENIKATEKFVTGLMLSANIADDVLRPALSQLVRATGDTAKAQELLALSSDIAAGSQKDLGSVTTAISKAVMGQYTALAKLGIPLSEGAKKSGDFTQAQRELTAAFGGAANVAANTLDGRLQNLNLRYGEIQETLGYELLPAVEASSKAIEKWMDTSERYGAVVALGQASGDLGNALLSPLGQIKMIGNGLKGLFSDSEEAATGLKLAGDAADVSAAKFRVLDEALSDTSRGFGDAMVRGKAYQDSIKAFVDSQAAAKYQAIVDNRNAALERSAAAEEAETKRIKAKKEAFKELGKTLRADLAEAVADAKTRLEEAREAADAFGQSIADVVKSGVSLATAYNNAADGEDNYKQAVEERRLAYEQLNQAGQTRDLDAYQEALKRVAEAEAGVVSAQAKRTNYASAFADQIAAAKTFSTNLQTLINPPYNLGEAGLSQLLDLGPVAGAEVAKALVDGTAGFTTAGLNESLAGLSTTTGGLAADVSRIFRQGTGTEFSAASNALTGLLGTSVVGGPKQTYTITVNAAVGDPDAIAKQVVGILQTYNTRFGRIPITV